MFFHQKDRPPVEESLVRDKSEGVYLAFVLDALV
jgi:hypothetical protein